MDQEALAWLRQQIETRAGLARHAISLGNSAVWEETSSGVLVTGEPTEDDAWNGTHALGDSSAARLMAANDPRDTLDRCHAELSAVDCCARVIRDDEGEEYWSDGHAGLDVALMALGAVAYGYRHCDGYAAHAGRLGTPLKPPRGPLAGEVVSDPAAIAGAP